jgi:SAM-dependent methyltransferase
MKPDEITISVYNKKTADYKKLTKSSAEILVEKDFSISIPVGGSVLDYGCGPGRSAGYFAECGLKTHAFDASVEMVKLAKTHAGVKVWQGTFQSFSAHDTYDGIWASFSLLHAPREDMPNLLKTIHGALKAEGKLYLALKLGTGQGRDALGRFYTYYEKEELQDVLKTAGFTWTRHITGASKGLDGTISEWISVLACA